MTKKKRMGRGKIKIAGENEGRKDERNKYTMNKNIKKL